MEPVWDVIKKSFVSNARQCSYRHLWLPPVIQSRPVRMFSNYSLKQGHGPTTGTHRYLRYPWLLAALVLGMTVNRMTEHAGSAPFNTRL